MTGALHTADIGQLALWGTFLCAGGAFGFSWAGAAGRRPAWARLGRGLTLAAFALAGVASAALLVALVGDDFSLRYVAQRSSRSTPLAYKIGAWWGGQEGSLLFWTWLLLGHAALVVTARPSPGAARLWPAATAVLMAVALFFSGVTAALESPFGRLDAAPSDGAGLNPLLQSPSMLAHPVALYLGYVGVTVPFAFMAAGLLLGVEARVWARVVRRWILGAWLFLGAGILLGGEWAYKELGWGGFWAWDPVENASLVPWLLLTACMHSAMAQEHRGELARWTGALLAAAFVAVLLGTFVTRSGILVSIHAFAQSPSGPYFLAFVGLAAAFGVWLLARHWDLLGGADGGPDPASRQGLLVAGNVVLVALAFTVAFGTAIPILSRLFGPGISVQAPYFEMVTAPLFAAMLLLMGLAVAAPWQPGSWAWLRRHGPELAAAGLFGLLVWLGGVRRLPLAAGLACAFVAGAIPAGELVRRFPGAQALRQPRFWGAVGGLLAHLGVAVVAVSVAASVAFQARQARSLAPGESTTLAGYTLRFDGMAVRDLPEAAEVYAAVSLFRGDSFLGTLEPARRFYRGQSPDMGVTTEVAVYRRLEGDVYVALAGWEEDGGRAAFEFYFNPLVSWVWAGGLVTLLGTGLTLALHPAVAAERRRARARVLAEAGLPQEARLRGTSGAPTPDPVGLPPAPLR